MNKLSAMVRKLRDGQIQFVLVGGYAAVANGASLVIRDVDICCPFSKDNLQQLHNVLRDVHPRHRMTPQKLPLEITDDSSERLKKLYLETDLCVLDCLSEVAGIGRYEDVLEHSVELQTPDGSMRVMSLYALIRAKEAMNRPHDRLTVTQLPAIKERTRES